MKGAIVHDWLVSPVGGGEKCLAAIHSLFPSPIYTLVHHPDNLKGSYFEDKEVFHSWIQKLPWSKKKFRNYLPLFPLAIEDFDLSGYDCILSSSHCVAKGVVTHPHQLHICYCHTPVRYAWDLMHSYLQESRLDRRLKGGLAKFFLHYLRNWDVHSSSRVDEYIANSKYVASRIQKYYGRSATVIYPPVDLSYFEMEENKEEYYVAASRLVPYKKIGMIVEAFAQMPSRRLVVIGDGPERGEIEKRATKNVEVLGHQPNSVLKQYLQKAKGFVFAAREDFGILPVEAMACGTPVIGLGQGGLRETVVSGVSGLFFEETTVPAIQEAITRFEQMSFSPFQVRAQAERFSKERFDREYKQFVEEKWTTFRR